MFPRLSIQKPTSPGRGWTVLEGYLLADAKSGEDAAKQLIAGELPGDFSERGLSLPQLFGQQLAGPARA